jgi:hypothetical protein
VARHWNVRRSVSQAVLGAHEGGMTVRRIEIDPETGKIVLLGGGERDDPGPNPWDVELPK